MKYVARFLSQMPLSLHCCASAERYCACRTLWASLLDAQVKHLQGRIGRWR